MSRLSRLALRGSRPPSEREWDRSTVLEPQLVPRQPELISDGGGLPFSPLALAAAPESLDPEDPAVGALITQINAQRAPKPALKAPWKQSDPGPVPETLKAWRLLARTEDEGLFARGQPPQLLTAAVRRHARRGTWSCTAVSRAKPLRAVRDGVRASSWRADPGSEVDPESTVLRLLVTEQTYAGGERAHGRVLAPNLHIDEQELVLTMFVTPRPGFNVRSPNPETPVRVVLPQPVAGRRLTDAALYGAGG